ncbi:DUF4270 domain-containing protein [Urechidicola croceus]|uniref:DUF4270 domain-containing protein n=1 Tax=Urechidicola croceus TaxID=1850246 RepID=A0A1D8P8W3_9FLAO|nr:DUF4270 domain-containing protein [Urechidicola croceus]AOW21021.1 hypothetical protein LPB138_10170 [Urechidicola croceus]
MTTKVVRNFKHVMMFSLLIIGVMSCESDIEGVGVNLVENGVFDTQSFNSDVTAYNQNILKRRAHGLGQYLLGVYKNDNFGKFEASIVTQLTYQGLGDFGIDPSIDTVILHMPYQAIDTNSVANDPREFQLDSVYGNKDVEFNLNVYELDTYLNTLDPLNPSDELIYYSDQDYEYVSSPLFSGAFKPNAIDTVLYVKRQEIIIDSETLEHDIDTIKNAGVVPSIKIPLNEDFFTNNFLNNPSAFESTGTFIDFFNGLYIQATEGEDPASSVMSLNLAAAKMSIYFTNTVLTDETITTTNSDGDVVVVSETDLNNDGDTTDEDVPVRTKQTANFNFSGVTANTYTRDYTSSEVESALNNPNSTIGDEKLYIQGAAGSIALIDILKDEDIEELRANNWLINEAKISFYVDQEVVNSSDNFIPKRLFLYNYDENLQISDVITEGPTIFGGTLLMDDNGEPYKYQFNITDYLSKILDSNEPVDISKLALKVYNINDIPASVNDVIIDDYNWDPRGIVLHGSQSLNTEKRIKLEIIYSEIN